MKKWELMDTKPFKNNADQWDSVFRPNKELSRRSHSSSLIHAHSSVVPGRATILKSLLALDEDRKRKPGMTRKENVIDAGITYEARQ